MKTKIDKSKSTRHRLSVEVSHEKVVRAANKALSKIQKDTSIKGFRKGEVPLDILRKYLGKEADQEIIKQVISDTYAEALRMEGATPISEPYIEHEMYEEGKPFTYHASFDVMPEITPPEIEGLKLEKEKVEVTPEEVEAGLARLRHSMTHLEPVADGALGPGMVGVIDFTGTADGKPFKGGEAKDFVADFGSMLPEFEKQIEGMKVGEERDITVSYPADYFNKEIAGKQGNFKVKVKEVRRKVVPELNDDFAKSLGKFQKIDEVKEEIKKQIASAKESYAKHQLGAQAVRNLVEKNQFEVPEVMVSDELNAMLEDMARRLESRGQTLKDAGVEAKNFVKQNYDEAANRVRGYLLAFAIAKKEAVAVTDEELEKRLKAIAQQTNQRPELVKEHFKKHKLTEKLRSQILYEKTLDLIVSKAKVKEVKPKKK